MKKTSLIVLLILWVSFSGKSPAEEWRTYTVAGGLKDNTVHTIATDSQGTVWFGTATGASKFDGARWQSHLDDHAVRAILIESPTKIWFGTEQGVFLKNGEMMTPVLPDVSIQDIVMDGQGVKWFAIQDGICSTVDGATWENYPQITASIVKTRVDALARTENIQVNGAEASFGVMSIAVDKHDRLWFGANVIFPFQGELLVVGGVGRLEHQKWELLAETYDGETTDKMERAKQITSLVFDENDDLWYSRWREGAFRFDGKEIHRYFSQDVNEDGVWFGRQSIVTIADLDGDGREEVIATAITGRDLQPRGLYVYDLKSGEEKWQYRVGPSTHDARFVAIGDVTGDGKPEAALCGWSAAIGSEANGSNDSYGFIFILDHQGKNLWRGGQSEPLTEPYGEIAHVAVADLDQDGISEVVGFIGANLTYREGYLQKLGQRLEDVDDLGVIALDGYGNEKGRFRHPWPCRGGVVADLNGDGFPEIVAIDDQGTLMIFDHTLALKHRQQFPARTEFVAIADLYGDGSPEILLRTKGKLLALDSQWMNGELALLWEYTDFSDYPNTILSDVEPGGAAEILITTREGRVHVLGYEAEMELSSKSLDTGQRYIWEFYSLNRTRQYPYAPSVPLEPRPFRLKHLLELKEDIGEALFTGDVNGDGKLELITHKDDRITVWEYNAGEVNLLWQQRYLSEQEYIRITALEPDDEGHIMLLADRFQDGHPELLVIDGRSGAILHSITAEAGVTDQLRNNRVRRISIDKKDGGIWFATEKGVSIFDGRQWRAFSTADGLASGNVTDIAFDTSNNVWFATSAGATRLSRTIQSKSLLKAAPSVMLSDDAGAVWVGTLGDGIKRYGAGTEAHYLGRTKPDQAYEATAVAVDVKRNALWAGIWNDGVDAGLYKFNLETTAVEEIFRAENSDTFVINRVTTENSPLVSNRVTAITLDPRDGSLWLGTSPHRSIAPSPKVSGLNKYQPDTGQWESWASVESELPIPNVITALAMTDAGILWVGTENEGVRRFDTNASGKAAWGVFTTDDGLAHHHIYAIALDPQGIIWFATPNGASRYDENTNHWRTFKTSDGLAGNDVRDIKIDADAGLVYFATDGGVSRYDGKNWLTYDKSDGLLSNFVYGVALDKNRALWMVTKEGEVTVRQREFTPPDTFITAKPDGSVEADGSVWIEVPNVTFEYSGADLGTPESRLLYQHKLVRDGVSLEEEPWSNYTSQTRERYTNLEDGTYTFSVRAVDRDGNPDPEPEQWRFTIDTGPPIAIKEIALNEDLFRTLYLRYASKVDGKLVLENRTPSPVIIDKINLFVPAYMDEPTVIEENALLPGTSSLKHEESYTDFRLIFSPDKILEDDRNTRAVQVKVEVFYQKGERPESISKTSKIVPLYGLGQIPFGQGGIDIDPVLAFIEPNDPVIGEFVSKALKSPSVDVPTGYGNIYRAMQIFDALVASHIQYRPDPQKPFHHFASMERTQTVIDTVKYPRELLSEKGGDCDDLVVAYAAMLEKVGIETVLLCYPGHVFLMFDAMNDRNACWESALCLDEEKYEILDDEVWIPVEVTALESFTAAWTQGHESYRRWKNGPKSERTIVKVHSPKEIYPSHYPKTVPPQIERDDETFAMLVQNDDGMINRWRTEYQEKIKDNQWLIGLIYAQTGQVEAAKEVFESIIEKNPKDAAALANLGNLYQMEGKYDLAIDAYQKSLAVEPDDAGIRLNLGIAYRHQGQISLSNTMFSTALTRLDEDYKQACSLLGISIKESPPRVQSPEHLLQHDLIQILVQLSDAKNTPPTQPPGTKFANIQEYFYWKRSEKGD
ncbi:tetratricopeptide repeat protein [Candidatus Poribacteria bacterium]|nr:tetratricopeptide repeat protein [Candidatus Poribacteria bacterium]